MPLYDSEQNFTMANCQEMDGIAQSPFLRAVLCIHTISSLLGLPLLAFLFRWTLTRQLMHYNTKFIIIFNVTCLVIHLLARLQQHLGTLYDMHIERNNGCEIIPNIMYCFYTRLPYNCALWLCYSMTIILSIERCIATRVLRDYNRNRAVGPLLIAAQVMVTSLLITVFYLPVRFTGTIYYCMAMSPARMMFTVIPLSISMLFQSIAIITFTNLRAVNKRLQQRLRGAGDYGGRYQVEETLRSLNTLAPLFYSSCIFILIYLTLMCTTMAFSQDLSMPVFLATIEGTNWIPQLCVFLPLLLWYQDRKVNKKVKNLLSIEVATTPERYEEELRKMWR
ncbi:unnamed protein product [Cylicocyclus nassatus]|uniref:G-protein coupled receptors family 1 profile domain-containing protein n=1 Tax=Cylicocyclus nassatus TaxID=53992 RepID=A0AA36H6B0_CYLNA|nr:unnamed protein product [Cylicocyclus nassatus]